MKKIKIIIYGNALFVILLTLYLFFIPGLLVLNNISDPALQEGKIPAEAWRLHKHITPLYAKYAKKRIASKVAGRVDYRNVPATEWPLFGSVFYLWATENLQEEWEKGNHSYSETEPAVYAKDTIEACRELLMDPVHHTWVKTHWGDNYMHTQNVFFRSLIIAGLTSYEKLTKSGRYIPLLKDQCNTLAAELDRSPHGILYDYPGECYPIDVFAAVAWIKKADTVTGLDHSDFFKHELRAFRPPYLDDHGMIPWLVDPVTGKQYSKESRGIINSHVLTFAPDIYPEQAEEWYRLFEKYFWQKKWYGEGWREFYKDSPGGEWTFDIDSGPIIGGFSPAANAFGFAAAERNGRIDHAYLLGTQVLASSWPLPNGSLLLPKLLSEGNAPYLGECGILWQLSVTPPENIKIVKPETLHWAGGVTLALIFYFGTSILLFFSSFMQIKKIAKVAKYQYTEIQFKIWCILMITGAVLVILNYTFGLLIALLAVFLPKFRIKDDNTG